VYVLTESPARAPDHPAQVDITFDAGIPLAVNGVTMPLTELIASVETIAGAHGVGRMDGVPAQPGEGASREILEAPAAVVLHAAHKALQRSVTPRDLHRLASDLGPKYVDLIERGLWFTPTREASDALLAKVQERVTGHVRVKLFKGQCQIVGTESPHIRARASRTPARVSTAGKR
jgi:argininosuccinate synthase